MPKQRNTKEENEAIKAGKTPEGWEQQPAKNAQNSERKDEAPATTSGWGLSPPPVRILSGRVAGGVISPKS